MGGRCIRSESRSLLQRKPGDALLLSIARSEIRSRFLAQTTFKRTFGCLRLSDSSYSTYTRLFFKQRNSTVGIYFSFNKVQMSFAIELCNLSELISVTFTASRLNRSLFLYDFNNDVKK